MNIPDTDEDLFGIDTKTLDNILEDRDEIINNESIPELIPDKLDHFQKPFLLIDRPYSSTAYDRIRAVFSPDPMLRERELNKLGRTAQTIPLYLGISIGVITGAMRGVVSYDEFLRENRYSVFSTQKVAMRYAVNHSLLQGMVFGISTCCKVTIFTGGCYTLPLLFSAIQGKTSYWEYAAGWGITSSLYCFNRGFKRMLIAGMIAVVPGLVVGASTMLAYRMSNSTFEELYAKHLAENKKI